MAQDKFKEINEAYQILSNEETRARYDQALGIHEFTKEKSNIDEDSFYSKILKQKYEKEKPTHLPPKPFNLEEELMKLERIKLMRQMDLERK